MSFSVCFFFFKQKTAYEMRISDWSSDVCSSDLACHVEPVAIVGVAPGQLPVEVMPGRRRELIGEDAQCAAIALAKGMQIVEIAVKRGSSRDETSHVEAEQGVSRLQCRHRGFEASVDFVARRIRTFIAARDALAPHVSDLTGTGW